LLRAATTAGGWALGKGRAFLVAFEVGTPLASTFMQERRPRGAYVSMGIDLIPGFDFESR